MVNTRAGSEYPTRNLTLTSAQSLQSFQQNWSMHAFNLTSNEQVMNLTLTSAQTLQSFQQNWSMHVFNLTSNELNVEVMKLTLTSIMNLTLTSAQTLCNRFSRTGASWRS